MANKSSLCKIMTIGHSTHLLQEFIELLKKYSVETVVDVRTIPVLGMFLSLTLKAYQRTCWMLE